MRRFSFRNPTRLLYRLSFLHGLVFAGLLVATLLYGVGLIDPKQ